MVALKCKECNIDFYGKKTRKFCGTKCSAKHNARLKSAALTIEKKCEWCDETFYVISFYKTQRFCTTEHMYLARRQGNHGSIVKYCEACGDEFIVQYKRRLQRFCDLECKNSGMFNGSYGHFASNDPKVAARGQKISKKLTQNMIDGKLNNSNSNYKTGWFHSNKCNSDVFYRSSYELKAFEIIEADEQVQNFTVEPFSIEYEYQHSVHRYVPDILIKKTDGSRELIEIKPNYALQHDINILKRNAAIEWCSKNYMTFRIWTEDDLFEKF